jgi:adenylate cyclase
MLTGVPTACSSPPTGPRPMSPTSMPIRVGGELQAVGTPVNIASRIEALNKRLSTRLLASARVVRDLEAIATRPLGSFALPGKTEPAEVVEILGPREPGAGPDLRLRERFAQGLALAEQKSWPAARTLFTELAREYPDDGPTRYYRELCDRHGAVLPS